MSSSTWILVYTMMVVPAVSADDSIDPADTQQVILSSNFTGDQLTVFYVSDVLNSARFYGRLGFELDGYYDYEESQYYKEWPLDRPPGWAQVTAGPIRIGLTLAESEAENRTAHTRHYFIVEDVDKHYQAVMANGLKPQPMDDRPWMRFFDISDPDGHTLVFGTRKPEHETGLE